MKIERIICKNEYGWDIVYGYTVSDLKTNKLINHRENGPAAIYYSYKYKICDIYYQKHNNLHREDGPAHIVIYPDGFKHKYYYLFNIRLSKEQFEDEDFRQSFIMEHS